MSNTQVTTRRFVRQTFSSLSSPLARFGMVTMAGAVLALGQPANRVGIEPVGLMAFSTSDVAQTSEVYKACPASRGCEIAFLAYAFTHSASFTNADAVVQNVLPTYTRNQVLVVTIYLDSGANRDDNPSWCYFHPELNPTLFWTHVRDETLHNDWLTLMARPAGNWIRSTKAWANAKGYGNRIRFIIVPVLEDAGNLAPGWAYQRLRDWTAEGVADSSVTYRRSSIDPNATRIPGIPVEFHAKSVGSPMVAGDLISDDGVNSGAGLSEYQWLPVQASAHAHGMSALWWVPGFNSNTPNRVAPWLRGPLKPFTNNSSLAGQAKALMVAQ